MFFVVGITAALILYFGGQEVVSGQLILGDARPVQRVSRAADLSYDFAGLDDEHVPAGSRVDAAHRRGFARQPRIRDAGHTLPIEEIRGNDRVRDVSVSHGDHEVLRISHLRCRKGRPYALVGRTGAGKSTLVNLIPRILEADKGQVLIDGTDVRRIPLALLRRSVGYASQDTFLFSTTLRENVGFGVHDASEEQLVHAVDVSRLSKDLEQFPNGLETIIGERGVSLSGGQKQRTSLARAVARDPAILILDDAMSSVDTQTQSEILYRVKAVMASYQPDHQPARDHG